jgi:hypothetical protein
VTLKVENCVDNTRFVRSENAVTWSWLGGDWKATEGWGVGMAHSQLEVMRVLESWTSWMLGGWFSAAVVVAGQPVGRQNRGPRPAEPAKKPPGVLRIASVLQQRTSCK